MRNKVHQKIVNTHILNSCFSKRVFESEYLAWCESARISEANDANNRKNHLLYPYECSYCKKFHLSKKTQNGIDRNRKNKINVNNFKLRKKGPQLKKSKKSKKS